MIYDENLGKTVFDKLGPHVYEFKASEVDIKRLESLLEHLRQEESNGNSIIQPSV